VNILKTYSSPECPTGKDFREARAEESCALVVLLQSGFSNGGYGIARNVRGEPVFSVMAAGWFCEKSS
jgi:hypothetical protein